MKNENVYHLLNCPECDCSWDGGSVYEAYKQHRDDGSPYYKGLSDKELEKRVKENYGPPYRYSKLMGIEIMGEYDGVLYWRCPECLTAWHRFTGEKTDRFKNGMNE